MNKEAFNKIVKIEYLNDFKDWYDNATSEQLKGLRLIEQIYNTKGRSKIAEISQPSRKNSYGRTFDLQKAEENYRKKQITTSYQWTFGASKSQHPKQTILKYKTLSELSIGSILTDSARSFIDSWLTLGDDAVSEECILSTLRAVHAKLMLRQPNNSQMKTKYVWKIDWNLSNPLRMDKAGSSFSTFQPNYKAIQKQRVKQQKLRKRLQQLEDSDIMRQLTIYKQFKIN